MSSTDALLTQGRKSGEKKHDEKDLKDKEVATTGDVAPTDDGSFSVSSIKSELTSVHPQSSFEHHSGDLRKWVRWLAPASKTASLSKASSASEVSFCSHLKLE